MLDGKDECEGLYA